MHTENDRKHRIWRRRLKGLGVVGFLFFLVKGLMWLAVFFFGATLFTGC
jgi:hypothetical protein